MATIAAQPATSHDNRHPMSFVAYLLVVLIIPALGMLVNGLATSDTMWTIIGGVGLALCLIGSGVIYTTMAHRLHHSPLIPDASSAEIEHYVATHPH
ncbi:hypothetical protein ACWDTI_13935 [Gordonia sp. NPDC003424]